MILERAISGRGAGALMSYMTVRLPRPTTSTSLWPAVTRTASRAPVRSSAVLVATIRHCTRRSKAFGWTPSRTMPASTPADWLAGVDGVFTMRSLPASGSNSTRSVNVPPTSTPSQSMGRALSTLEDGFALLQERAGTLAVVGAVHGAFDGGDDFRASRSDGAARQGVQDELGSQQGERCIAGDLIGQGAGRIERPAGGHNVEEPHRRTHPSVEGAARQEHALGVG